MRAVVPPFGRAGIHVAVAVFEGVAQRVQWLFFHRDILVVAEQPFALEPVVAVRAFSVELAVVAAVGAIV